MNDEKDKSGTMAESVSHVGLESHMMHMITHYIGTCAHDVEINADGINMGARETKKEVKVSSERIYVEAVRIGTN